DGGRGARAAGSGRRGRRARPGSAAERGVRLPGRARRPGHAVRPGRQRRAEPVLLPDGPRGPAADRAGARRSGRGRRGRLPLAHAVAGLPVPDRPGSRGAVRRHLRDPLARLRPARAEGLHDGPGTDHAPSARRRGL
ncbi:MAG: hypothetical protein AVDCRST_MAG79-392, partial [uncultured Thermoleophilia bacterium]